MIAIFQLTVAIISIVASIRKGDWNHFERYYPTLLYLTIGNLTYEYIAHSKFHLWEINGVAGFPESVMDFFYLFVIVTPSIFIYLSGYPDAPKSRILHIIKWILIFTFVEWVGGKYFNTIDHHHGWNIWWSLLFNIIMFPMLRLHYLYYKRALLCSIPITLFYLLWFDYI